jgi:pyruvate formate lyase activating enzyme
MTLRKRKFFNYLEMDTLIVDLKRNSLDDGPGIRTVIFFKGCPLSCVWCQNPETKSALQEIYFNREDCLDCKKCLEVCHKGAIDFSNTYRIIRAECDLCGNCIENCPTNALKFAGKKYEINELVKIILKDKIFYENSGGGVTLSGGEPTLHIDYLNQLLKKLKKNNIHICLETCGYYNNRKFNDLILPYLDLIYFDLKLYDLELHQKFCKVSNELIIRNFDVILNHIILDQNKLSLNRVISNH